MVKSGHKSVIIQKILAEVFVIGLSILALQDLYANFPLFSAKWRMGFWVFAFLYLLIVIFSFLLLFTRKIPDLIKSIKGRIPNKVRWFVIAASFIGITFFLLYTQFGSYFQGAYFRLSVYLFLSALFAYVFSREEAPNLDFSLFLFLAGLFGVIFAVANYCTDISTYPFSHSWSEGNRFYDYSLIFGKGIYNYTGELAPNYESPGRYGLWGIWFLIQGMPIWFHRLWNAFLWAFTPIILGVLVTRKISSPLLRWGVVFWFSLFIMQGPVYPTLLLALIFLAPGVWSPNKWVRGFCAILSSIFVGMSRYFWVLVPGVWIVLFDLFFEFPKRKGKWFERLTPTVIFGLLGVLPGTYFGLKQMFSPKAPFEMHQPLLFYRLLPNATYPLGILINFVIDFSPILLLLIWIILKQKIKADAWVKAAMAASLSGFAVMGFVASTKIGGGSNLHNLDMFIVTISLIFVIIVTFLQEKIEESVRQWPKWINLLLVVVALTPGWIAIGTGSKLVNPAENVIQKSLEIIRKHVELAKSHGDVLFIDQRQLLTFGYIKDTQLIPDYEKKYMMDQAMGNNTPYFDLFYQDLKKGRFSLIISDPLTTNLQGRDQGFSEENNAYVDLVSKPILTYYYPLVTLKEIQVQLLVPRTSCHPIYGARIIIDCTY